MEYSENEQNEQKVMMHHLYLLGFEATDIITGTKGVISNISFDLYGCIQASLTQKNNKGVVEEDKWIDVTRLIKKSKERVLDLSFNITVSDIYLLGFRVVDIITNVKGIATSVCFGVSGDVRMSITQSLNSKNPTLWVHKQRISSISSKRVMPLPNYHSGYVAEGRKGCAEKSSPPS